MQSSLGFIQTPSDIRRSVVRLSHVSDAKGHLLGEYDAHGRAILETVYLGGLPVAVLDGTNCFDEGRTATNIHYVSPDNLGVPHVITDERNRKVWQWNHAPFGDTKPTEAAGFTYDLRFPGQIADAESGLSNNGFRAYNPMLGRYTQSDPMGLFAGINTYAYVGSHPVWASDPLGLDFKESSKQLGQIACVVFHLCTSDPQYPQTPIDQPPQMSQPAQSPTEQAPLPPRQPQKPNFCPPQENPGTNGGGTPSASPSMPSGPNIPVPPIFSLPPSFLPPMPDPCLVSTDLCFAGGPT